ncbi:MAG: hypothetical protein ACOC4J_03460, partial [Bacteroidota bacterium]
SILRSKLIDILEHNRHVHISNNKNNAFEENASVFYNNQDSSFNNDFVNYLNTLQRIHAGNENSLAESQACNPFFADIHVSHPLTGKIVAQLLNEGRHVILTGHAGDGKSSIALEVFKQLKGLKAKEPLDSHVMPVENITEKGVTIIKDLSERERDNDTSLINELMEGSNKFLLVTNTGTLLDFLKNQSQIIGLGKIELESEILASISNEDGEDLLNIGGIYFYVLNLALINNLSLARNIFEKMLTHDSWNNCLNKNCNKFCPILNNVTLIRKYQERIVERIFWAYQRMYEYGTRLTIRQLTEHLSYLITSGIEEETIKSIQEKSPGYLKSQYLFFNRFFGDNGSERCEYAHQMQAIKEVDKQGFGYRLSPTWERMLWLRSYQDKIKLGVVECENEFGKLRSLGSRSAGDDRIPVRPDMARVQVRRMLYFLYDFSKTESSYMCQFLNSPVFLQWQEWQKPNAYLGMEKNRLEQQVYHVLQEHLTGVRLPEASSALNDRRLYVTLSRRRNEVRQSAQVVLAQVDWSTSIRLELKTSKNVSGGVRTDLVLSGQGQIEGVNLFLTLPFLDYVLMRHFGEIGEVLQTAYLERLDRFKAQLQEKAGSTEDRVMLVRLKTDHTFRRQNFLVRMDKLEVSDVL